ncbi:MAG TPA: ornithine carbamoyltransferase [Nitrososphaeraceae archaeon]|jgi:ornithine carbamoyltransferase|nr:ornithine carbamoyltransferase [Thermoproteota archaeon]MDQ4023356.1 ornithine carbamoyltransferase [Thermoproteota archaeon]HKG71664.1 ornithine carbamoyltransferase [Nitrososphaeraceae archaeon]HZA63460.1 ornithine carbamoyltransferase [Nitrososphaeraceae archaeon]
MKTSLNNKDVLSLQDLSSEEILSILRLSGNLKNELMSGDGEKASQLLKGKVLGMIFQKPSTRTRVSFETGIFHLGGNALYLSTNDMQLSRGESIEDTGRTLSLYVNCIVARVYEHADVQLLADSASIPVINGLSDTFHPCQILADLLTIQEHKKKMKGLNLAWIGDGNNVCNDLLLGCAKTGINMTAACPHGYEPLEQIVRLAREEEQKTGAEITITDDPLQATKDADIIVTDTFLSIGKDQDKTTREEAFLPRYQVNSDLLKNAKRDVIFMHCLPAKRGQEVTSEVIDGSSSVIWDEAENRLHVQKALMCMLMLRRERNNVLNRYK